VEKVRSLQPKNENSDHTRKFAYKWKGLYDLDREMATAAVILGRSYGYALDDAEPTDGMKLSCGFVDTYSKVQSARPRKLSQWQCKVMDNTR
jgi:hypothetical protein